MSCEETDPYWLRQSFIPNLGFFLGKPSQPPSGRATPNVGDRKPPPQVLWLLKRKH